MTTNDEKSAAPGDNPSPELPPYSAEQMPETAEVDSDAPLLDHHAYRRVVRQRNVAVTMALVCAVFALWSWGIRKPALDGAEAAHPERAEIGSDVVIIDLQESSKPDVEHAGKLAPAAPDAVSQMSEKVLPAEQPAEVSVSDVPEPLIEAKTLPESEPQEARSEAVVVATSPVAINAEDGLKAEETIRQRVQARVRSWADAWSDRDVSAYLSSYSKRFEPGSGMNRERWAEQRQRRIEKPDWIRVEVTGLDVTPGENEFVSASFLQRYSAPGYSDEVFKTLELVYEDGDWLIVSETTVD